MSDDKRVLKKWDVSLWVVLKDGQIFDYAYSRSQAFKDAREQRQARPNNFWTIAPAKGTLTIEVPA